MENRKKKVIFTIVCCRGNSRQYTRNTRCVSNLHCECQELKPKAEKQMYHFQLFILLQVYILLILQKATLNLFADYRLYLSNYKIRHCLLNDDDFFLYYVCHSGRQTDRVSQAQYFLIKLSCCEAYPFFILKNTVLKTYQNLKKMLAYVN